MSEPTELICSARGCGADATHGVLWNNPRIHTPTRRKVWLACPDHNEHLSEYLRARSMWKETITVAELAGRELD